MKLNCILDKVYVLFCLCNAEQKNGIFEGNIISNNNLIREFILFLYL